MTIRRLVLATLLVPGLLGVPLAAGAATPAPLAPVHGLGAVGVVPGRYIVVLKDRPVTRDASAPAIARAARAGVTVERRFRRALAGYTARLSAPQLTALRADPDVAYIEADHVVHADTTESPATWGLDRVDQRALPLSGGYSYTPTGAGVTAYVIDTGVRASHAEFTGRASGGFSAIQDGRGTGDCNGHGTHVAGTIGGAAYGVAKGVAIVAVRVLDCSGSGTVSGVIAGVDWVTANHANPAVANMSLGGGASQALDDAVSASIASGVTYSVAAGNTGTDACAGSPARVPAALTVGASTNADSRDTRYSDIGACLDLFAPGTGITSAWNTSDTATNTISGTSMAAPHVAGVAALYLQDHPAASPTDVAAAITSSATPNVLANVGTGSPNLLLYSPLTAPPGGGGGGTGPCATTTASYPGTLSGTGASAIQPGGTYYSSTVAGTHVGCLTGPATADFDLYLYRWNGRAWAIVARSDGTTSTETIAYPGAPGYYYWRVVSFSGSGSYLLKTSRP